MALVRNTQQKFLFNYRRIFSSSTLPLFYCPLKIRRGRWVRVSPSTFRLLPEFSTSVFYTGVFPLFSLSDPFNCSGASLLLVCRQGVVLQSVLKSLSKRTGILIRFPMLRNQAEQINTLSGNTLLNLSGFDLFFFLQSN